MSGRPAKIYNIYITYAYQGSNKYDRSYMENADRKKISKFIKNLENDDSYHTKLFKRLSDDDLAYFLYCITKATNTPYDENNSYMSRQWYDSLKNFNFPKEFDFRLLLNKDFKFCTCAEDLEDISKKEKITLNERYSLEFYKMQEQYGNPINMKHNILYKENIVYSFDTKKYYISLLQDYLNAMDNNADQRNIDTFDQIDIFLILLEFSCLELLKKLNVFFDNNLFYFSYHNDFYDIIKKLKNITREFKSKLNIKLNDSANDNLNLKTVISYISGYYHFKNISSYYTRISDILVKDTDVSDRYLYLLPKHAKLMSCESITLDNLLAYCGEDKNIDSNNFKKDYQILSKYIYYIETNDSPLIKSIPIPALDFNFTNLLDFKIIYRELIMNCFECYNNSQKYETVVNISTINILKRSIDYIEHLIEFKKDEKLYEEKMKYDSLNYDTIMNQKNNVLFKHTVLLTEKIRKGFYREYGMMNTYKEIAELEKEIRELFVDLFSIPDPYFQMKFFSDYYNEIYAVFLDFINL